MSETKIRHDATASTKAILFQLWIAVEKCYEMHEAGQKILVEKQGDVSGDDQVEVKQYSDNLTDNHLCFWKTLRNWVQDDFDPTVYNSLILLTTQSFGPEATIARWNNLSKDERLKLIQAIHEQSEERHSAARAKKDDTPVPESLQLQQYVFAKERKEKLVAVLDRFVIEAMSPRMPDLHARIKGQYLKGVMQGKKDDFLSALFVYISQPANDGDQNWEITFEDFSRKVEELTGIYGHDTRTFPSVSVPVSSDDEETHKKNHLFAQKILDIEYPQVLRKAIEHYHVALKTVNDEFKTYLVLRQRTEQYTSDVVDQFNAKYRTKARNCSDAVRDSKDLYDDVTGSDPLPLSGFDATPLSFRNGLLHAEMDDESKSLKWRIEPDE